MKVSQISGSKRLEKLWPLKFCAKADVNLYLLTGKLLRGNKIFSDC